MSVQEKLGSKKHESAVAVAQRLAKSSRRRARRPSLGNGEFLNKALDLFLERGFERTSIEEITATAGMAKRTVYLRYGDKKTLFKAALRQAIEDFTVPVDRLHAAETDDLEESLQAVGQILVDNILSPAGLRLLRLTNAESGHMPEIGVYSVELGTQPTLAYLADLFRRHLSQDGVDFPDADDAAEAFLHLVVGGPANAAAWGVRRDKEAIDRRVRYSVRTFLHGLLPGSSEGVAPSALAALRDNNRRLEKLLVGAMIELDRARERIGRVGGAPERLRDGAAPSTVSRSSSAGGGGIKPALNVDCSPYRGADSEAD